MQGLEFSLDHPTEVGVGALLADGTCSGDLLLEEGGHFTASLFDALREEVGVLHSHHIRSILLVGSFTLGALVQAGK